MLESLTMKVPGLWLFNKLIASSLVMCGLYHHLWFSFTCTRDTSENFEKEMIFNHQSDMAGCDVCWFRRDAPTSGGKVRVRLNI